MSWVIYYSDNTTISDWDVSPYRIERRADVQVIIQDSPEHKWFTLSGYDFYVWDCRGDKAQWFEADHFGLDHYLLQPGFKCVLFGTRIDKKRFREIFDRARAEMGEKHVFMPKERHP